MPAPRSATLVTTKSPAQLRGDGDGLGRGRILIRVFEQMDESFAGARNIHTDARQPGLHVYIHDAIAERESGICSWRRQ